MCYIGVGSCRLYCVFRYWFYSLLTERYLVCVISGWGVVGYPVCLGIGFMVFSLDGIWCVLHRGGEL